ncbi:Homeodomain-like superfamily protein [Striga hermonthica]|uniref:Homeodomain-like superfamily protein n=1 Tax=Striga hermonthica TaxID=68872 RepID=A0A9N7RFB7_STRHE|nr:Homeodomain-like superfamily protein [Striga hermonthica]
MGSLILPELSSDFKFTAKSCVRRTIGGETLPHVSRIRVVSEKILKLEDYASRLRDEMKKVDAFKRELPLCLLLLRDAIVATEDELAQCRKSSAEPVLEEFIPMKRICRDEGFDKVESRRDREDSCRDKMNWMSSVQLWNSDDHPSPDTELNSDKLTLKLDDTNRKRTEEEMNLFQNVKSRTVVKPLVPFAGCTNFPVMSKGKDDRHEFPIPNLSLCTPELKSSIEGLNSIGFSPKSCSSRSGSPSSANVQSNLRTGDHQSARKQRRCWSPDLHRQFINALQQLGGAQVATPKQIRELMQVDGLTNDEVKSHLQKYRLHSRRLSGNSSSQSVGVWMPEEHCNESRKRLHSGSPEGPFHLEGTSGGNEDEYDENYEHSIVRGR